MDRDASGLHPRLVLRCVGESALSVTLDTKMTGITQFETGKAPDTYELVVSVLRQTSATALLVCQETVLSAGT